VLTAGIGLTAQARTRDHYQCYAITASSAFAPRDVLLQDQFGQRTVTVVRPAILCAPVKKNEEPVVDPVTHFVCYDIQPPVNVGKNVRTRNQFGRLKLTIGQSVGLCVPSRKTLLP
jgi:hypothetical protein